MRVARVALTQLVLAVAMFSGCSKKDKQNFTVPDERVAQQITCVNNLKQLGLGFHIWSDDHGDKNPFEVSTNAGGVMELVTAKDGFRKNGYLVFQCMSNELTVPLIVVCPQAQSKNAAKDWASLSASNVSYLFPATSNVLVVCPIDGNILYTDWTVLDKQAAKRSP